MRIHCTTSFLDGRERYERDDILTVDGTKGAYFVQNGWAKQVGADATAVQAQASTDLNIQNSAIGVGDSNG